MEQLVRDYFKKRLGHSFDSNFVTQKGALSFDIRGSGTWRLSIDKGNLDLEESRRPAQCTLHIDETDFVDLIRKKRNFLTTFFQGRIEVEGDRALAAGGLSYLRKLV